MRFIIFICIMFLFCNSGDCKVIYNPDTNTLWIEDGREIEYETIETEKKWQGKVWTGNLEMKSTEDGLIIKSTSSDKSCIGRYLKFDRQYPYLVWEITKVNYGSGYRGLTMAFPDSVFNFVTHIYPGIFVVNPFLSNKKLSDKTEWCRIYLYNSEVYFKYIKMVKIPENYIVIESSEINEKGFLEIGDEVKFKVILDAPSEDVSLTFYDHYITHEIKINGSTSLQLKPEDQEGKIWSGKIKINSCEGHSLFELKRKSFPPGTFLIKATVLGGKLKVPLWTANWFEFKVIKEEEAK